MSIWCSWEDIGYDTFTGEWVRGEVRSYATGFSNHYPTTDGTYEQPSSVGIATIPVWCVPGHREEMDKTVGPWVRLDVWTADHSFTDGGQFTGRYDTASVVMDETAARSLAADLLAWADREKAHPQPDQVSS